LIAVGQQAREAEAAQVRRLTPNRPAPKIPPLPTTPSPDKNPVSSGLNKRVFYQNRNAKENSMPPAARIGDMHTCPMVTPGTPPVPHVGGPILPPGCPTVLIGGQPAARVTDMCTCVGPPDVIAKGSPTVMIGNLLAARMGDQTVHGGVIVVG